MRSSKKRPKCNDWFETMEFILFRLGMLILLLVAPVKLILHEVKPLF
jgi:hypothetical protein